MKKTIGFSQLKAKETSVEKWLMSSWVATFIKSKPVSLPARRKNFGILIWQEHLLGFNLRFTGQASNHSTLKLILLVYGLVSIETSISVLND